MFLFRGEPSITLSEDKLSPETFIMPTVFLPEFQTAALLGEWMLEIELQVFVWLLPLRKILAWNSPCFHIASLIGVALKNPLRSVCVS